MRTLRFLLQKEFRQIFRNPTILRIILAMPVIQLIVLPLAADYEIKNINIAIADHDHSSFSQQFITTIQASHYFKLINYSDAYHELYAQFEEDKADLIIEIPDHFERNLVKENKADLFVAVNAINGSKAMVGSSYLTAIIQDMNNSIRLKYTNISGVPSTIKVTPVNWFNPFLNYRIFMVPGILVFLVTMVGAYMCSLNIVKEKEAGTIEQINVTPIKKIHFILGKLIPFWIIGMVIFSAGLFIIARVLYGIVPVGNVLLLYAFLAIYLVAVLGIGLLISTYSETQQQAMSVAFFFMMIFLLMSGLFTSIDAMPAWAKLIARLNPVTYFIEVNRMIILKGSGLADIKNHFLAITAFAIFFNTWAVWNYKKTV